MPLRNPAFQGQVYRLVDLVLDMPSLIEVLAERQRGRYLPHRLVAGRAATGTGAGPCLAVPGCTVRPRRLLLTAGTGNESLHS